MKEVIIETKLEPKDYLKLVFVLTLRKAMIIILIVLAFILLIWGILSITGIWYHFGTLTYIQLLIPFIVFIWLPLVLYIRTKKYYISNKRLQEMITYTFNDLKIQVKGESFSSELTWEKTYKIVELKNWILIYQNRINANVLQKRYFNQNDLEQLKDIIKRKKSIIG